MGNWPKIEALREKTKIVTELDVVTAGRNDEVKGDYRSIYRCFQVHKRAEDVF